MFYGSRMTEILNQTKPHMANTQEYNMQWKKSQNSLLHKPPI